MRFYHPRFLTETRKLCDHYDVLLILDEIATGFGRTGELFGCNHAGISPDFLCLGKALPGGYMTLAATLTTEKIFRAFLGSPASQKTFFHGHTYTGNPLCCATALANLEVFKKEKVLEIVGEKIG